MHVLLAESEPKLREDIHQKLKENGNVVDVLVNGDMALQLILEYQDSYDLVILDSRLPIVNGTAVCREIKNTGIKVPVLLLISEESSEARKEAFECGANDFIIKPFSLEELSMRITALAKQQAMSVPVVLTSDGLTLHMLNRTVVKGEKSAQLTNKEALLLEYLIKNKNKVVSRHGLFSELWGADSGLSSNVVDAHVKNLRKKLRQIEPDVSHIDSVRGIGYRFNSEG